MTSTLNLSYTSSHIFPQSPEHLSGVPRLGYVGFLSLFLTLASSLTFIMPVFLAVRVILVSLIKLSNLLR